MRVFTTAYFCCCLLFLNASFALADTYGWPLRENFGISATFGEYRYDHFHGGIDLSTNGDTGLPVLAVADGEIYRLKIQKRAYGKAIYIRHADGFVSLYAHLESYSTDLGLEQLYKKKIMETGTRYMGDILLDTPIKVRKGDVVAFSGETGAGLPHLHFELRKTESIPVNPLTNGLRDSLDPVPPTFQAIYLYPQDATSAVDGELETKTIGLKKEGPYFVPETKPVVRGDFLVSVSAYDSALRPYHRAPRKLAFSVDSRLLYELEFNEFSYLEPASFGLVYDLGKPGPSSFEHPIVLTQLADVRPSFTKTVVPFATHSMAPGIHTLEIEASDSNKNTSIARVDFIVNHPPTMRIDSVAADATDLVLKSTLTDPDWKANGPLHLAGEVQYSIDNGKTFLPFPQNVLDQQSKPDEMRIDYRIPTNQITASQILVKARGYDGVEYSPYFLAAVSTRPSPAMLPGADIPSGNVRVTPYSRAVKVSLDTKRILPAVVSLQTGQPPVTIPMDANELTSYETVLPAPKVTGPVSYTVGPNAPVSLPVYFVPRKTSARINGENYELLFEPDNLFWDTFVWLKSLPASPARDLPVIGPSLQIGPRGVPMKNKAAIRFRYPADLEKPERLNIYIWNRASEKWSPIGSKRDSSSNTVVAGVGYFDLYALIYDNVAPVISFIFPNRNSSTTNPTPKLAAKIQDSGMDVDDEKVTFFVDNLPYSAEYDPDRNVASVKMEKPLSKGYHSFYVVAYDYAGNKTESTRINFGIK